MPPFRPFLLAFAVALTSAGCGGGSSDSATGSLSVRITDAPVDNASDVVIQVAGLEVHGGGNTLTFDFAEPRSLSLLALTDGASELLLDGETLPAGHYEWIRLKVSTEGSGDSYVVTTTGENHEITIPSGSQTGLKLNRGFDIPAGGTASFTIDFDLRKSLVDNHGDGYLLKPVLRIVDNVEVGAIAGNVDLTSYGCDEVGNAVYVYAGSDVAPGDMVVSDETTTGPLLVAPVRAPDDQNDAYHYRAAFLTSGSYTVAFTCDADTDLPEQDDTLEFKNAYNVTVTANGTTVQDFPAPAP